MHSRESNVKRTMRKYLDNPMHHVHAKKGGYEVMIKRQGVVYRVWLSASGRADGEVLAEAMALRDKFVAMAGPLLRGARGTYRRSRSNTGIPGISEFTRWMKSTPREAFAVGWRENGRARKKFISYGAGLRSREVALRMAVEIRRRVGAVVEESQVEGACL